MGVCILNSEVASDEGESSRRLMIAPGREKPLFASEGYSVYHNAEDSKSRVCREVEEGGSRRRTCNIVGRDRAIGGV